MEADTSVPVDGGLWCGNTVLDPGEQCDGADLGGATCDSIGGGFTGGALHCSSACAFDTTACTSAPGWDPSGSYAVTPEALYSCGVDSIGAEVAVNTVSIMDDGVRASLTSLGLPCRLEGLSVRAHPDRRLELSCMTEGPCGQGYAVSGSFADDVTFTGTLTVSFVGMCFDCTNQTWAIMGSR